MTRVTAIQMVSTPVIAQNCATVAQLLAQAVQTIQTTTPSTQLILLPEYWPLMGMHENDKVTHAEVFGHGPIQDFMSQIARQYQIWLIGGTIPIKSNQADKIYNALLVFDPNGACVCRYDKVHLFGFNNESESYEEARTIVPGDTVQTFTTPFGKVGLSVCYDLRFPELYRAMGICNLMVVPAAFTYTTGRAHWEILLRARAIENQCYVLAAAQGGTHLNGRRTWGHSMLIDPWGTILSQLEEGEGIVSGDLDFAALQRTRDSLPALTHRKLQ